MTHHSDPNARPPLTADDPRISEWIDGRLTAAEAAEVERAVGESAVLLRLVADLRALKAAARLVPARSPSAGFVDRVMNAVAAPGSAASAGDAASDRVVEQEWHAIDAERIAEERAEAEADLAAKAGPVPAAARRAWPWVTIATALAAGLFVALVLNRPHEGGPREVAQVTAEPELDRLATAGRRNAAPAAPPAPAPAAVAARLPARDEGAGMEKASRAKLADASAPAAEETAPADRTLRRGELPRQAEPRAAIAPAEARAGPADTGLASGEDATAERSGAAPDRPVVVTVESWTEFDRLLEAHGIEAQPIEGLVAADRSDKQADWMLELSGPPARLDAFLAAAAGAALRERGAAAGEESERPAAGTSAPDEAVRKREGDAEPGGRRLLVRLVIRERELPTQDKGGGP